MMPVTSSYGPGITGAQGPIGLDYMPLSKITAAVSAIGTGSYTVEVTLDDVFDQNSPDFLTPATASWFPVAFGPVTDDGYINFDGPWRAIRLNIVANDNGLVFQVAQAVTPRH